MININYKNLTFYQLSHKLSLEIYKITKSFPEDEKFGLISQLRRAAISITSNIAEGSGKGTIGEFKHFYIILLVVQKK